MANKKISQLTAATTPLAGTEVLPIVQSGNTVQVSVDNLTTGKTVTSSGLNVNTTTPFNYNTTSGAGVRIGTQGTSGGSMMVQTASLNSSFGSGLAVDGSYSSSVSTVNLKAFGVYSGGPYYSKLAFWTSSGTTLSQQATLDGSTGNFLLATGNIVPSKAAKGVNFTANTPAAGMTSQLLNWYEEGTFTPTITAGSGTLSTVSGTCTYTRTGRTVYIDYNILITANGSGAGYIKVDGLPYTASSYRGYGAGSETDAVGFNTIEQVIGSTTYFFISKVDGTYPGGSGYRLQGSLTYKV